MIQAKKTPEYHGHFYLVGSALCIVTVLSQSYPKHIGADFSTQLLYFPNIIVAAASIVSSLLLRPQTIAQPQIDQTLELQNTQQKEKGQE